MKKELFSGYFGRCHCQGIAVDQKNGYIYYSFTTLLVKSDLEGKIIGTVENIIGHLGCIDFNDNDGKLYASLEYKNDSIGKGILAATESDATLEDGFYIAIFDTDKIERVGMDAEKDGVMRAVYLKTVVDDYKGSVKIGDKVYPHVHGCSGIDGLTIGPDFGKRDGKDYLYVCYGIYSDTERSDNDYQVILQYEIDTWYDTFARPLLQSALHKNGPNAPKNKFFLYTGNTVYGIQNFEYDAYTGDYFACVYKGKKEEFPNYPMFVIDGSIGAKEETLRGYTSETKGLVLTLKKTGEEQNGISGINFQDGSTGFYSFGDGSFYVSVPTISESGEQATKVFLYKLITKDGKMNFICEE